MTKTICDICGKEMLSQKSSTNFRDFNFTISSNGRKWDICDNCRYCIDRLITIRNAKKEENK